MYMLRGFAFFFFIFTAAVVVVFFLCMLASMLFYHATGIQKKKKHQEEKGMVKYIHNAEMLFFSPRFFLFPTMFVLKISKEDIYP